MQLIFVLFEPQVPENVGAATRALTTMGFDQLRVVNSRAHQADEARWLAHGSWSLLEQIEYFETLDEALADCDFVIGTTAKSRTDYRDLHRPEALPELLEAKASHVNRVALVFGREDSGLPNTALSRCDLLSSIPLAQPYPSLNLGQTVMLYAYALSGLTLAPRDMKPAKNSDGQLQVLKQQVCELLLQLGHAEDSNLHQWALQRLAQGNSEDIRFLHSLCRSLNAELAASQD